MEKIIRIKKVQKFTKTYYQPEIQVKFLFFFKNWKPFYVQMFDGEVRYWEYLRSNLSEANQVVEDYKELTGYKVTIVE